MCEPDDLSHRDDKLMKPIGTIHILRNQLGEWGSKPANFLYFIIKIIIT